MARVNGLLNNFANGEITPRLRARSDLDSYSNSNEIQVNFHSEPFGEMRFREGTKFQNTAIKGTTSQRMVPFVFDSNDAYFLQFATETGVWNYLRIFNQDGTIENEEDDAPVLFMEKRTNEVVFHINAGNTGNWATTKPVHSLNLSATGYTQYNFESVLPKAVSASAQAGCNREIVIEAPGATASGPTDVSSLGITLNSEYVVTHPFVDESVYPYLQFVQKEDTMFIASNGVYEVYLLQRTSAAPVFAFQTHDMYEEPPGVTASTQRFNGSNDRPRAIALHDGRLWIGGTNADPDKIWGSDSGVYTRFSSSYDFEGNSVTRTEGDGVELRLAGNNDGVTHLLGTKDFLYIQTIGGGYSADGGGVDVPITYNNFSVRKIHDVGSEASLPLSLIDGDIFFVERNGLSLRVLDYNFDRNKYVPLNISKQAEHLCRRGMTRMAYARGVSDKIYLTVEEGDAITVGWDAQVGLNGWSRYQPGWGKRNSFTPNEYGLAGYDAILDVVALPGVEPTSGSSGNEDIVMFTVLRNGFVTMETRINEVPVPRKDDFYVGSEQDEAEADLRYKGNLHEKQLNEIIHMDSVVTTSFVQNFILILGSAEVGNTTATAFTGTPFVPSDVGRRILGTRLGRENYGFGVAVITGYVSSTVVNVEVQEKFRSLPPSTNVALVAGDWYLEAKQATLASPLPLAATGDAKVGVIVDGRYVGDYDVDETKTITVEHPGSVYHVGIRYLGVIKSMNLQGGGTVGPSETKPKNISRAGVIFRDSTDCRVGSDLYKTEDVVFEQETDRLNSPTPLYTGEKMVHFKEDWNREKHIYIVQDQCAPCNVQAIVPYFETSNE